MLQKILIALGSELVLKLFTAIKDFIVKQVQLAKLKKDTKEKVHEINNESDAQTRAKRMRDFLNS